MKNKMHRWKIMETNIEETVYRCTQCQEEFYVDESDPDALKTPPRKGCQDE